MRQGGLGGGCPVFGLVLGLACVACSGPQTEVTPTPGMAEYADPVLAVRSVKYQEQSFAGCTLAYKLELVSTDERPARLQGCSWTLELKDLPPGAGDLEVPAELPGQGRVPLALGARAAWPTEDEALLGFLGRERVPYKLRVTCQLETPSGPRRVEAVEVGSAPVARLPRITISDANAERYNRGLEARVNFDLGLVNENPFRVNVKRLVYKVYLEGTQVAEGDLSLSDPIPANNETSYEMATPIYSEANDKEMMAILKRSEIHYRIEATLSLDRFALPLDVDGKITFSHQE